MRAFERSILSSLITISLLAQFGCDGFTTDGANKGASEVGIAAKEAAGDVVLNPSDEAEVSVESQPRGARSEQVEAVIKQIEIGEYELAEQMNTEFGLDNETYLIAMDRFLSKGLIKNGKTAKFLLAKMDTTACSKYESLNKKLFAQQVNYFFNTFNQADYRAEANPDLDENKNVIPGPSKAKQAAYGGFVKYVVGLKQIGCDTILNGEVFSDMANSKAHGELKSVLKVLLEEEILNTDQNLWKDILATKDSHVITTAAKLIAQSTIGAVDAVNLLIDPSVSLATVNTFVSSLPGPLVQLSGDSATSLMLGKVKSASMDEKKTIAIEEFVIMNAEITSGMPASKISKRAAKFVDAK